MSFIYRDKFWYYTINTVLSILILFPILIILILSFKTTTEIRFENFFSQFTFNNFFSIWDLEIRTNKNTFKQSLFNSLVVTSGTVVLSLIIYVLPIGFFLMFNSFNSIPKSLREVAILNDSSEIKILFLIMIPLAIPGLITLIIFAIYVSWTDYLLAFIIMNSADMQMLNVTLSKIGFRSIYPYAGYVISYLPFMIIFILLQKFYFKSIISST
jgi:multiple sugar transport system permease protein